MKRKIFVALSVGLSSIVFTGNAQQVLTLEEVISKALEHNYDVRIAQRDGEVASIDNHYAWGAFLPQINGTANYTLNSTYQQVAFENTANNREGNAKSINYAGSVQAVWTLFDGTRMFATRERLRQLEEQGVFRVKEQMTNTIASVITNYYDIVRQKQHLRAIQEQMSVNEERVKLAERKLQVGTGAKPELLQARVDLNAQRTTVLQQQALIIQLKENLNVLVDNNLPEGFEVADSIEIVTNIDRQEITERVSTSNFGLLANEKALAVLQLSLRERRAEKYPTLNAVGTYTITHTDNVKLINPFQALQSDSRGLPNYGFTLAIPILNGFTNQRQVSQAKLAVNRQELVLNQQRRTLNANAKNAFTNYQNAIAVLVIEEENILLAKENVTIALESYKRGVTTFVELRTAQQSLETAYNRLITARYNAKVAETELLRLSGSLLK